MTNNPQTPDLTITPARSFAGLTDVAHGYGLVTPYQYAGAGSSAVPATHESPER